MAVKTRAAQPTTASQKWVLVIAVALGLTAALLNWLYVGEVTKKSVTLLKFVGPKPLPAGTAVTRAMFRDVVVTGDVSEMKDALVDSDSFAAFNQLPVTETLKPGHLLMTRSFYVSGEGGLRDSIGANEIALSLRIDGEAQAVGYNVRPGDLVEIWGDVIAEPILIARNVCVKAVGDAYVIPGETSRDGRYRSVTVFIPDDDSDQKNFLFNVNASENRLRLMLKGACAAGVSPNISPKAQIRVDRPGAAPRPAAPEADADADR
jgi:hypothetical protein